MRVHYTEEQKAQALQSIQENGISKTSEAMGISIQTLYKWRGADTTAAPKTTGKRRGPKADTQARKLLAESDDTAAKLAALQAENTRLRETNLKLRKALAAMLDEA
ncbi:MAG: transposase [Candidatus Limiplasma sp.]|nr:transposase [Candidatus Limiplasma sp.]